MSNLIDKWKARIENLNLQFHLGSAEAADEFENQKKYIRKWAAETSAKVNKLQESGKSELRELKIKLEELEVQASLGKADAKDALKSQQKNISRLLHDIEYDFERNYNSAEKKIVEFSKEADEKLQDFHTKFDMLVLQMNLGKAEAEKYWAKKKKDLSLKLSEMERDFDVVKEKSEEKWDEFSDEMSNAWKHFKKAFK